MAVKPRLFDGRKFTFDIQAVSIMIFFNEINPERHCEPKLKLLKFLYKFAKHCDFPVIIKHPISNRWVRLLWVRHKGYWWHGLNRHNEEGTASAILKLVQKGDVVFELGGHIGYLTQIFESLVGPEGKVVVFEPSPENISLLAKNVKSDTIVERAAVSNSSGNTKFYMEDFGGFTNSLKRDFTAEQMFFDTPVGEENLNCIDVPCITLDEYTRAEGFTPDFLKIDIEGGEYQALLGSILTLRKVRAVLIEVSRDVPKVFDLLHNAGFIAYRLDGQRVIKPLESPGNIIFVKKDISIPS